MPERFFAGSPQGRGFRLRMWLFRLRVLRSAATARGEPGWIMVLDQGVDDKGERLGRRAIAAACSDPRSRMTAMRVRSPMAFERVRKIAAIEIGMPPISAATGSGICGHWERAAAA